MALLRDGDCDRDGDGDGGDTGTEHLHQTASKDENDKDVPPRKRMRLDIRQENILKQIFKPNGGPCLRSDSKQHQRPSIMSLPPEIIQNIFFRLRRDERQLLRQVCKKWLEFFKDPIFNTSLTIKKEGPSSFYCETLRSSPLLKELRILERENLKTFLQIIKKYNPFLEVLRIDGLIPDYDNHCLCHGVFFIELKHLTNLKVLSLTNVSMYYKHTVAVFSKLENLKRLELVDCDLNSSFLDAISSSDVKLEEFVYRNMFAVFVPHETSFQNFFKKKGPSLKVIKLSIHVLIAEIQSIAENCKKLHFFELRLRYKSMSETSFELLGTLKQLQCLNLYEVQGIKASTWCNLLSQPSLSHLKSLGLSFSSYLEDSVFETIANNMKHLESAALSCSHSGAAALQHIIKNCSKLKTLTLSLLTSKTIIQNFPLIPHYLPNLRVLSFRPTGFSNEHSMIEQIELETPGLKINYIYEHADFVK